MGGRKRGNKGISIHASAKEATRPDVVQDTFPNNFNPRLREGGDIKFGDIFSIKKISIHASAKEATVAEVVEETQDDISIHASAKEAT